APAPADKDKPAEKKKAEPEDPYLTNWKEYEHREERLAGRGPQGKKMGFGVGIGRPLSLTGKLYFTQTIAAQADVGVTYSWYGPEFDLQGQVIWHWQNILVRPEFKLSVYVGGGMRAAAWPLLTFGIPPWLPACQPSTSPTANTSFTGQCTRPAFIYLPGAESFPGTLGLQGVGGISMFLTRFPVELYAQPLLTLEVFPGISGDVGAQVGARYYFF
ncbi:MAG: hypothetical protein AB2A00_40170, partial [Myxococcota bacterium]